MKFILGFISLIYLLAFIFCFFKCFKNTNWKPYSDWTDEEKNNNKVVNEKEKKYIIIFLVWGLFMVVLCQVVELYGI